jgi:hypothetical protein
MPRIKSPSPPTLDPLLNREEFERRYGKRLAIVVPYRDRARHLAAFITRITRYFERDKLDRHIAMSLHVVEQSGKKPFNAGKIRNCGYRLVRGTSDYVCFHDVDYLPIWADYSWTPQAARLCWHGLRLNENRDSFFGAVVLLDNPVFERVNGYPNAYWGWGSEDLELGIRCRRLAGGFEHRDGTYLALEHKHRGFAAPGVLTEEAQRTQLVFDKRVGRIPALAATDGLSALDFKLLKREKLRLDNAVVPNAFHYLVDIGEPDPSTGSG